MPTLPTSPPLSAGNAAAPNGWDSAPNGNLAYDLTDSTYGYVSTNASGNYDQGWELGNMPTDFASILTLSFNYRYAWSATPSNTTWDDILVRIMDGATVLAASDSGGTFQSGPGTISNVAPSYSSSGGSFNYVNTSATKTQWDAAVIELRLVRSRVKGGGSQQQRVTTLYVDGTYTASSATVQGSFTADAIKRKVGTLGGFTADAWIKSPGSDSFTADAVIRKTTVAPLTVDAVITRQPFGSFTADAIRRKTVLNAKDTVTIEGSGHHTLRTDTTYASLLESPWLGFGNNQQSIAVGQKYETTPLYTNYEGFLSFPTGSIPDGATIQSAVLRLYGFADNSQVDFIVEVYDYAWAASGDEHLDQAEVAALTLRATYDSADYTTGANDFTDVDLAAVVNTTGDTKLILVSKEYRLGSAPSTTDGSRNEWVEFDDEFLGSTTDDPKLIVTYSIGTPLTFDAFFNARGDFTADSVLRKPGIIGSFTVDAVIDVGSPKLFLVDAIVRRSQTGSFTADAYIVGVTSGSFTADAVIRRTQTGSFTASAAIRVPQVGSLVADAVVRRSQLGSLTFDAFFNVHGDFTADAILLGTQAKSFVARAFIVNGETGGHIRIDGVDITDDVIWSDAEFTSLVNGGVGNFRFRVKDVGQSALFVTGAEVTLDIDGVRRFGGYLMQPRRTFFFPVEDTTVPGDVVRAWTLTGVDYNIMFKKRVVYNKTNPKNVELRSWPVASDSATVIKYVFDNYTDLFDDGFTHDGVEDIGSPNPDRSGVVASGGHTFGDAMREINRLLSGVWYFDPYKDLKYVDVDTPNASKSLSDNPAGGSEIGFREFSHTASGTDLVNDAMVWGAGQGSKRLKFARVQDTASQTLHGLWQFGEFTANLYKQASVNKRADTIVNGTAQSKRGGKDDKISWHAVTHDKAFVVGQKVTIESEVFGVTDVVPIRRMTVTFSTRDDPKFEMVLSHEIDEPWNLFEFWFPKFGGIDFPEDDLDPFVLTTCLAASCAADDFDRTVSAPDWGGNWTTISSTAAGGGVAPVVANIADVALWQVTRSLSTQQELSRRSLDLSACSATDPPWDYVVRWKPDARFDSYEVKNTVTAPPGQYNFPANVYDFSPNLFHTVPIQHLQFWFESFSFNGPSGNPTLLRIAMDLDDGAFWQMMTAGGATFDEPIPFSFTVGHEYGIHVQVTASRIRARMWNATTGEEPSGWASDVAHGISIANVRPDEFVVQFVRGIQGGSDPTGGPNDFDLLAVKLDLECADADDVSVTQDTKWSGFGLHAIEGDGATTVFSLPGAYVLRTTKVFVGGFLQRPGGVEYTETSPTAGTITFVTAPAYGAVIVVFYEAYGSG